MVFSLFMVIAYDSVWIGNYEIEVYGSLVWIHEYHIEQNMAKVLLTWIFPFSILCPSSVYTSYNSPSCHQIFSTGLFWQDNRMFQSHPWSSLCGLDCRFYQNQQKFLPAPKFVHPQLGMTTRKSEEAIFASIVGEIRNPTSAQIGTNHQTSWSVASII